MLLDYNKKQLEKISKLYGMEGAYKLKKAELIEVLGECIPANISRALVILTMEDLEEFERLIIRDRKIEGPHNILDCYKLVRVALVELVQTNKGASLTINQRIKQAYKELDMALIKEQTKANIKLRTYIKGLLNLYGAVQTNWVCELYNRDHKDLLDEKQLIDFVKKDRALSSKSPIIDNYIVEDTIYDIVGKNFYEFLELIKDKKYYIPTKGYIEQMSDALYYDHTLHIQKLKNYIRKNFTRDEAIIEKAILKVVMIARVDCGQSDNTINIMLEKWEDIGIEIRDRRRANETIKYIVNVINSTRKWINKGHALAELSAYSDSTKTRKRIRAKVSILDVGRNALCPCGSGKKHKECCGQVE